MTNETDEMRQARHDLQILSASDPAASANMLRHIAALMADQLLERAAREHGDDRPG